MGAPHLAGGKEAKQAWKHERELSRLLTGWEQYRTLWDGIDFKRQLINMGDKKVRFALVIMGALNAALLIVLTRGPILRAIPDGIRILCGTLLIVYGIVTFLFMVHAIEALRPRPEAKNRDATEWKSREGNARPDEAGHSAVGLFIRGPLDQLGFEEERRLWSRVRLAEVNAELILFNRSSSIVLTRQVAQLRKVYQGLKLLAILAALVLALLVGTSLARVAQEPTNETADRASLQERVQ